MELKRNAKSINNLLSNPKTRTAGLHLLNSYLFNCSDDDILEYCIGWMQNCCKIDSSNKDRDFAIETLGKIIQLSANYAELNKAVSFFISNRFSDYFFKNLTNSNFGWGCVKLCFLHYRGSCGPSKEAFEKLLFNHISSVNVKISAEVSHCFALLPSLGGCGKEKVTYQTNWKNQFLKFINIVHLILNDLFVNLEELNEYGSPDSSYQKNTNNEFLLIQLENYCSVIIDMLLIKYPGPKFISTDLILELICRGLSINPLLLQKKETSAVTFLKRKLPNIHIILLNVLKALITTCKTQLLPYSLLICKLIKQTLSWSQADFKHGSEKCFEILRISVYEVMCNWIVESKTGGCIDTISQFIIPQIIDDIKCKKSVLFLKVQKSNLKSDSKNNEKSVCRRNFSGNSNLNYAALKVLEYFLKFYGVCLTADDHKFLQETVVKLLLKIQIDFSSEVLIPYSVPLCRKALYSILFGLVQQPCPKWPPPTHFAFRIFKRGQYDKCPEISAFCSFAVSVTTNIIHQQYSNGPIMDTESIKNNQNTELFSESLEKESRCSEGYLEPEERENSSSDENINVEISQIQSENIRSELSMQTETHNSNEELKQGSDIISLSPEDDVKSIISTEGADSCLKNSTQEDLKIMLINENEPKDLCNSDKNEEDNLEDSKVKNNNKEENSKRQSTSSVETIEELPQKRTKVLEKENDTVPCDKSSAEEVIVSQKTPEKVNKSEGNSSEDSSSCHSVISERRYFLRSKTVEGPPEENKEVSKRISSPDLAKSTPGRGLGRNTPLSVKNVKHRPRTRALSKLEVDERETDFSTPKKSKVSKNNHDEDNDDCDIIEVFDDTIVE